MTARLPLAPILVVTGWALLGVAWLMATPPFRSPDETAHYVRAVGLSEGDLVGPRADFRAPALNVIGLTPRQNATFDNNTREAELPPGLAPSPCEPGAGGNCTIATYVGNYQPLPYVLPAMAVRAAGNPSTGDRLARAGALAAVLAFLALAVAVVWSGTAVSLVGITAAVTPMVLFTGSMMNPSGLGIAASLALTAAVVRIHRDGGRPPPWVFGAAAAGGAAALLSWQLGPVFVAANLIVLAGLLGRDGLRHIRSRGFLAMLGGLAAAGLGYLVWRFAAGGDRVTFGLAPLWDGLDRGIGQLRMSFEGVVGVFGAFFDVKLPLVWHLTWAAVVLALVTLALRAGPRRDRWVLASVVAASLVFPVLFFAAIQRHTGFLMQGRYILPLLMIVPVLAAETVARSAPRSAALDPALTAVPAVLAAVQLAAWWVNARSAAGGPDAPLWFLGERGFIPPGGWAFCTAVALAGCAALALSGPASRRYPSLTR